MTVQVVNLSCVHKSVQVSPNAIHTPTPFPLGTFLDDFFHSFVVSLPQLNHEVCLYYVGKFGRFHLRSSRIVNHKECMSPGSYLRSVNWLLSTHEIVCIYQTLFPFYCLMWSVFYLGSPQAIRFYIPVDTIKFIKHVASVKKMNRSQDKLV